MLLFQTQNRPKRKLSEMGRQMVRSNQNIPADEVASVVSAIINTSAAPRRRRHFATRTDTSTSTTEYENHLKIDRILYNAFGDIMSIARTTEIDWMAHYNDEQNNGISLKDTQNDAIEKFLISFVQEQPESFIEAIRNLSLSQEMPEPPTNNGNNDEEMVPSTEALIPNNAAMTDANNSEGSSIISVQRVRAPHSAIAARNILVQERSISQSKASTESTSKAASIRSNPRISSNSKTPPYSRPLSIFESKTPSASPRNAIDNASQFSFGGMSFQSEIGNMRYSSSSSSSSGGSDQSQGSLDDSFFLKPTGSFQFDNFGMDFNQSEQTDTQSRFFTQPFMRSQSHHNLCTPTNDADNSFSSQHGDLDDFERTDPFTFPSSLLKTSSESQQRRRRPNLDNIKKNAVRSGSLAHLPDGHSTGNTNLINF